MAGRVLSQSTTAHTLEYGCKTTWSWRPTSSKLHRRTYPQSWGQTEAKCRVFHQGQQERYGEQTLAFLVASVREQMQMLGGCQASRDKGFKTVRPPADSHEKAEEAEGRGSRPLVGMGSWPGTQFKQVIIVENCLLIVWTKPLYCGHMARLGSPGSFSDKEPA